jgi:hypothetical protein
MNRRTIILFGVLGVLLLLFGLTYLLHGSLPPWLVNVVGGAVGGALLASIIMRTRSHRNTSPQRGRSGRSGEADPSES